MLAALVLGGIYFLCCVVLFLGVREQLGEYGFLGALSYVDSLKLDCGMRDIRLFIDDLFHFSPQLLSVHWTVSVCPTWQV